MRHALHINFPSGFVKFIDTHCKYPCACAFLEESFRKTRPGRGAQNLYRSVSRFLHAQHEHVHSAVLEHWVLVGEEREEREESDPREEDQGEGEEQGGQEPKAPLTPQQKEGILNCMREIHISTERAEFARGFAAGAFGPLA